MSQHPSIELSSKVIRLRTALIYNPLSGSRHDRRQRYIHDVASKFESAGHSVTLFPTERIGHASFLAAKAAQTHDAILSAGGDGTAHEILQPLAESRSHCALGVLPFGTGNVLAKDIGLPTEPVAAARMLLEYKPRRIAAGRINFTDLSGVGATRYFTVAGGIGAHARLVYAASAHSKRRGGLLAYYYTGFHSLFTHPFAPMRAVITKTGGEVIERHIVEAVAMRISSFGGLLKNWRPGGALVKDDLRLVLLTKANRAALFRYAIAAFAGRCEESDGIEFHSATDFRCEALSEKDALGAPLVYAQADGEILGTAPISMSIVPDAFTLLMPPF